MWPLTRHRRRPPWHKVLHFLCCTKYSLFLITSEIVLSGRDVLGPSEDVDGGGEGEGTANTCVGSCDEAACEFVWMGGDSIGENDGLALDNSIGGTGEATTVENIG